MAFLRVVGAAELFRAGLQQGRFHFAGLGDRDCLVLLAVEGPDRDALDGFSGGRMLATIETLLQTPEEL